jgi:hypothetical protein
VSQSDRQGFLEKSLVDKNLVEVGSKESLGKVLAPRDEVLDKTDEEASSI